MGLHSLDKRRLLLILAAFFTGGAVPIQLITLSFGYAQYVKGASLGPMVIMTAHQFARWYIPLVYLPAMVALALIALYCKRHYPDIYRRIIIGFGMGAVSAIALDAVRQTGVIHGWLPGDNPVMFGKMATGSGAFAVFYPAGVLVHVLSGADFGLFYTFVWGKRLNYRSSISWAVVWLLIVELGMMTLPPMAPIVGPFGSRFAWPQLFLLTLVAHIAFGICLGILTQHYLHNEDEGGLFVFIRGRKD